MHKLGETRVSKTVRSLAPSLGRFVAEACVVADWGTIPLTGFSFENRIAMAAEIETCWPLLESMLSRDDKDYDSETKIKMTRRVDVLSHTRLLQPRPDHKRQLSFLSKYLHWCINRWFLIWDTYSRMALGHKIEDESKKSLEELWASYKTWLGEVQQEAANHRACCLEKTQLSGESPVRTLDEALYVIGLHLEFIQKVKSVLKRCRSAMKQGSDNSPANLTIVSDLKIAIAALESIHAELNGYPQGTWSPIFTPYVNQQSRMFMDKKIRKKVVEIEERYLQLSRWLLLRLFDRRVKHPDLTLSEGRSGNGRVQSC
jgi:hypothetical protein